MTTTNVPTAHATLSASGSERWMACPGSVAMSKGLADSGSESARWGTACHELAAECLTPLMSKKPALNPADFLGAVYVIDSVTYTVDAEMVEMVQAYIAMVESLILAHPDADVHIEVQVDYTHLFSETSEAQFGTADCILVSDEWLVVADLKTGRHAVEVASNKQLLTYASGAKEIFGMVYGMDNIKLAICQPPKSKDAQVYVVADGELAEHEAKMSLAGNVALDLCRTPKEQIPVVYLVPGEDQCRYCKAKAVCPRLTQEVSKLMFDDLDALATTIDPAKLPAPTVATNPEEMARVFARLDMVEGWIAARRAAAYEHAMAGGTLPGYKVVKGKRGNRAWTDAEAAETAMRAMRLKVDEMYNYTLISPTTAEKLLKDSPRKWSKVSGLIGQSEGKPTLVKATDKGEALDMSPKPAEDLFEDLDQGDLITTEQPESSTSVDDLL